MTQTDFRQLGANGEARSAEAAILDATRELLVAGGSRRFDAGGREGRSVGHRDLSPLRQQAGTGRPVVHDAFERFGTEMAQAAAQHPKGSLEQVRALGQGYVRFAVENETYFRVIFSIAAPHPRELD
jgi:hypothetical protein